MLTLFHLKAYLFAHFLHLKTLHVGLSLCSTYLVGTFSPCDERNLGSHPYSPHTTHRVLETVEYGGACPHISSHGCNLRQELGSCQAYLLFVYLVGVLELSNLGAIGKSLCLIVVTLQICYDMVYSISPLVGEREVSMLHTTLLRQQHLQQSQSVVHLEHRDLGLVELYLDAQPVGTRGKTLLDELLYISVQTLYEFEIALGKTFLARQLDDVPIRLVDSDEHILARKVHFALGQHL